MTYTAEQLRDYASSAGNVWYAPILRAHADALEERDAALSAAKAEAEVADIWREKAKRAEAELAKLRQLVAQQAEDEGLWFNAATAPEAYLQQELRRLHAVIEETK